MGYNTWGSSQLSAKRNFEVKPSGRKICCHRVPIVSFFSETGREVKGWHRKRTISERNVCYAQGENHILIAQRKLRFSMNQTSFLSYTCWSVCKVPRRLDGGMTRQSCSRSAEPFMFWSFIDFDKIELVLLFFFNTWSPFLWDTWCSPSSLRLSFPAALPQTLNWVSDSCFPTKFPINLVSRTKIVSFFFFFFFNSNPLNTSSFASSFSFVVIKQLRSQVLLNYNLSLVKSNRLNYPTCNCVTILAHYFFHQIPPKVLWHSNSLKQSLFRQLLINS